MCVLYQHQTRREKITFFTLASIDSQSAAWLTESNRIDGEKGRKIKPSLTRAWGGKWNVHKLLTLWSASNETLLAREAFREMKQSAKGAQSERFLARLIPSLCRKQVVNWSDGYKGLPTGRHTLPLWTTCVFKGLLACRCVSLFLLAFIFAIEENKNLPTHTTQQQRRTKSRTRAIFMNETTIKLKLMVDWLVGCSGWK